MEDFNNCSVCFHEYTEGAWVPKVLECGHSFCDKCLTSILQSQKSCPKCRATLSKDIDEYPTNFDLLGLSKSSKEKRSFLDACTSETIKNELKSNKKILQKMMAERDAITCSIESTKASTKKLLRCTNIICEADEIADVVPDIEACLEEVDKSLNYSWETDKDILRLKDFENSELFLSEIVRRLEGSKRVYSCTKIDLLGEWKYGEVTCSENRLHIHCLSSSVFDKGASLVLLKDVKDCITSRKDILPFIEVGSQRLWFTLTEDSPFHALRCLKFCTGEEGHAMKGLDSEVDKDESENLNRCAIFIPTKASNRGYEDALLQEKSCDVKEGEVTLACWLNWVCITKWSEDANIYNLAGKLHENCQIDFDKMKLENKITDCGISLQFIKKKK